MPLDIDTLISLDNHPEMRDSFVGDYHIWYDCRIDVLTAIISKHLKTDNPTFVFRPKIKEIISFLWQTIIRFPYFIKNKKIIFFSTNVVNMMENDGLYVNRLHDFFYNQYKNISLFIEEPFRYQYRNPRKVSVYHIDLIHILASILRRFIILRKDISVDLKKKLRNIRARLENKPDDFFWENLFANIEKKYKYFIMEKFLYMFFLKRIRPKIIFRQCGSYGGYQFLSSICNELNIIYAEFQHGLVSKNHPAYNYGDSFFEDPHLKKLLPQFFLTFGKYWSKAIRIPGEKIEVGFPYLIEKASNLQNYQNNRTNLNVLIVSDGNLPIDFAELVSTLANQKINNNLCDVFFKLHPVEVPLLKERYEHLLKISNVYIKTYEPIYPLILNADIIIGCSSTTMFESYQFKKKPYVYLNESAMASIEDISLFETFKTITELITKIENANLKEIENSENLNYLWEQHPKECFDKFINGILGNQ